MNEKGEMTVKETHIVEQFVKWKSRCFMIMLEVIVENISFFAYFILFYIEHLINWSFKPLKTMNIFVFQIFKFCWKVLSTFSLFADMQTWYGIFLLFKCSLLNWLDVHHWWDSSCNFEIIWRRNRRILNWIFLLQWWQCNFILQ